MFDNYHFDLANVLVGILVGFVVAFLIRMSALKKLDLKLNKIGLDLGIDGFEPEQKAGVRTGDISGQVHGDIVGGDKTVSTSNFFDKLQTSVQQVVGGGRGIRQRRRHSFRWESRDPGFTSQLKDIARSHRDGWTREWIDPCLSHPDCRRLIRQEIESCRTDGWQPVAIDSTTAEREFRSIWSRRVSMFRARHTRPNNALQRTRPSRPGCNRRVPRAWSLSLGRSEKI